MMEVENEIDTRVFCLNKLSDQDPPSQQLGSPDPPDFPIMSTSH